MSTVLVVANETIGGARLLEAVRRRSEQPGTRFVLCVPRTQPRAGLVIYDDVVFDAAQARVDLALDYIRSEGIEAVGEVGDPDPYTAVMDAVAEHRPDEIVISTLPQTASGWLRRDLIERVEQSTGLPVEHVVSDIDNEGLPFAVTLVVANRTASGDELLARLREKAGGDPRSHLFLLTVPQTGGGGDAARQARTRLRLVLDRVHSAGLFAAGMIGDPDPFTATMNALQYFRIDDVVISTHPETRSGWMRSDLIERVRRATGKPVDHVVVDPDAAASGVSS